MRVTEPPLLVVEVLSPRTRVEDTVRKSAEYAAGGVARFWVVDPERRSLQVLQNVDGGWGLTLLDLDDAQPTGEVAVGEHGSVSVDLRDLVRS